MASAPVRWPGRGFLRPPSITTVIYSSDSWLTVQPVTDWCQGWGRLACQSVMADCVRHFFIINRHWWLWARDTFCASETVPVIVVCATKTLFVFNCLTDSWLCVKKCLYWTVLAIIVCVTETLLVSVTVDWPYYLSLTDARAETNWRASQWWLIA